MLKQGSVVISTSKLIGVKSTSISSQVAISRTPTGDRLNDGESSLDQGRYHPADTDHPNLIAIGSQLHGESSRGRQDQPGDSLGGNRRFKPIDFDGSRRRIAIVRIELCRELELCPSHIHRNS